VSISFPTSLDSFVNPAASDLMSNANPLLHHDTQHDNLNDIVAALEAKVGIDASAVATSLDYLLKNAASVDPGHTHSIYVKTTGDEVITGAKNFAVLGVSKGAILFDAGTTEARVLFRTNAVTTWTLGGDAAALYFNCAASGINYIYANANTGDLYLTGVVIRCYGIVKAYGGYQSSDGSDGISATKTSLTSVTIKNGLITAWS
jgi:hypothetical protein